MSTPRITEILENSNLKPILLVLDNTDTFPYSVKGFGISVINTGIVNLVITLSTGIVISVPPSSTFEDVFLPFTTINATGSTSFQIGVR